MTIQHDEALPATPERTGSTRWSLANHWLVPVALTVVGAIAIAAVAWLDPSSFGD